jgi:peptidoglycan/xylan/chitin deacetylase (PgdA/CDA1 family)
LTVSSLRRLLGAVPNKRQFLARALGTLGVLTLLERLALTRRPTLVVLTYHRIAVPGVSTNPFYDPVISATPEAFEAQLRSLAHRFRVVNLDEILNDAAGSALASGKPAALVTFDDGYRDNHDAALPILRKLGVPATFFIPTGFLEEATVPWWDQVAYIIKHTSVDKMELPRAPGDPAPMVIALGPEPTDAARTAAVMTVIRQFLDGAIPDQEWFLAQLGRRAGVPVDVNALSKNMFMCWDHLRELAGAGMSIGSHGHSHRALGMLDEEAQRRDLRESRDRLEAELGRGVAALAYPYGWPGTFTATTGRLAAEAGYRLAFSSLEGVNHPGGDDFAPMALRRLNVGTGDSPCLLRARAALHARSGRSFL